MRADLLGCPHRTMRATLVSETKGRHTTALGFFHTFKEVIPNTHSQHVSHYLIC